MNTIHDLVLAQSVAAQLASRRLSAHLRSAVAGRAERTRQSERGEGIISVALAVLIMAALAAAMWVAYKRMWDGAATRTEAEVTKIGG